MSDLTDSGKVETRADGSKVFTHGHRYPDNTQIVTQEYGPDGKLHSARVEWTGFAGKVLDVTATFDAEGNLIKEDGFRAEGMTTPIKALLKPLPTAATGSATTGAAPSPAPTSTQLPSPQTEGPVTVPSLTPVPPAPAPTAAPVSAAPSASASVAPTAEDHSLSEGLRKIYGSQKSS